MRRFFRIAPVLTLSACMLASWGGGAQTSGTGQKQVDDAIGAAERVCLVGSRYKFTADLSGAVVIKKLLPGAQFSGGFEEIRTRGAPDFMNEEIRRFVDADIRACMSREWPRVLEVMKGVGIEIPAPGAGDIIRVRIIGDLEVSLETLGSNSRTGNTTFGLVVVNRGDKRIRLIMHNKSDIGPLFIDETGSSKYTQGIAGLPRCHWDTASCFRESVIDDWAVANKGQHLPFSLTFSWAAVPKGSLVNLRFTLLQATEGANGRSTFNSVPVSFLRVPVP